MMNTKSNLLFAFFTQPRDAIRYIIDHPPHVFVFFIFLFALVNDHIAFGLNIPPYASTLSIYLTYGLMLKVVNVLIFTLLLATLVHFSSDLAGSTGSVTKLYLIMLFSFAPYIFSTPAMLLTKSYGAYFLVCIILGVWSIVLQIKGVQEVYRFPAGKAFFVYILPFVFMILLLPIFVFVYFLFSMVFGFSLIV